MHISVSFADVHVVADSDDVSHEGDHVCCLAYCLAVRYLGFALIQILDLKAEHIAGRSEGEAGARGVVAEQRDSETALEYFCGNVVLAHVAECIRDREDRLDLVVCLLPCQEEVAVVHILKVQCVQLIDVIL